jgi:hypothetical protein
LNPQPQDEPAEEELSLSILRLVDDPQRIESLQQMLSGFNHRCRNSLNGIKMSLYLFKRQLDGPMPRHWAELERTYQGLERLLDRLQVIYRPLSLTLVRAPLGQLINERWSTWSSWFNVRGRTLQVESRGDDLPGDFDPMYLGLGLDAFVGWRAEAAPAGSTASMAWSAADGLLELSWQEGQPTKCASAKNGQPNGPKVARPDRAVDSLALPLLARIVAAHGGSLEVSGSASLEARLRWPRITASEQGK